jgi:hypothetical protein
VLLHLLGSFSRSLVRETSTAQVASLYAWSDATPLRAGPNDGGIKRGDRGDVDDTEARPTVNDPAAEDKKEEDPTPPGVDDDTVGDSTVRDPDASDTDAL